MPTAGRAEARRSRAGSISPLRLGESSGRDQLQSHTVRATAAESPRNSRTPGDSPIIARRGSGQPSSPARMQSGGGLDRSPKLDSIGSPGSPGRRRRSLAQGMLADGLPTEPGTDGDTNVQVMLRVRPFNKREQKIHEEKSDSYLRSIIEMPDGTEAGKVHFLEKISGLDEYAVAEEFQFDKCLWSIPLEMHPYKFEFCSQEVVYEHVGAPALRNAWNGFNTCIFAYGQTGAGKTHTMMGPFTFEADAHELSGSPGVIPQLCKRLYQTIEEKREQQEQDTVRRVKVTYETQLCAYEIYNERVRDLFFNHTPGREPGEELKVRKHPVEGPFVDGISKLQPDTWQRCLAMIEEGNQKRTVGATAMNADSSRSHSVFQIKFSQVETSVPKDRFEKPVTNRKYSIINLIDLAGSERNKKSMATGDRLVEAANINLSLTTLKRVIDALVHNSLHPKNKHQVPYRDSVLTMLLMHSLGGNSKTMMVACVSPHYDNADETLSTLRYASAARKIVNVVKRNEDSQAKQNLALKEQLESLQAQLEQGQDGGFAEEEIEELMDQIEVGREQLETQEKELRNAEKQREQLRKEKAEEEHKRYQAAFQHSFQMVVLKRQKELAVRKARQVDELRQQAAEAKQTEESLGAAYRELERLREKTAAQSCDVALYEKQLKERIDQEGIARDELLKKAYGKRWFEQQMAAKEEKSHQQVQRETIEASAKQHAEVSAMLAERESELRHEVESLRRQHTRLKKMIEEERIDTKLKRETADEMAKAHLRELRERDAAGSVKVHKWEVGVEALRREAAERRRAHDAVGTLLRSEASEKPIRAERRAASEVARVNATWEKWQQTWKAEHATRLADVVKSHGIEQAEHLREKEAELAQHQLETEKQEAKRHELQKVLRETTKWESGIQTLADTMSSALRRAPAADRELGLSDQFCDLLQELRCFQREPDDLRSVPVPKVAVVEDARRTSLEHADVSGATLPLSPRRLAETVRPKSPSSRKSPGVRRRRASASASSTRRGAPSPTARRAPEHRAAKAPKADASPAAAAPLASARGSGARRK